MTDERVSIPMDPDEFFGTIARIVRTASRCSAWITEGSSLHFRTRDATELEQAYLLSIAALLRCTALALSSICPPDVLAETQEDRPAPRTFVELLKQTAQELRAEADWLLFRAPALADQRVATIIVRLAARLREDATGLLADMCACEQASAE